MLLKLRRCYFNQLCIIIYPRSVLISARRYLPAYALTDKTSDQAYTKSLCCNRNVKTMISPLNKQYVFADWCTCTSTSSILIKLRDALQFDYYKGCFRKANYNSTKQFSNDSYFRQVLFWVFTNTTIHPRKANASLFFISVLSC